MKKRGTPIKTTTSLVMQALQASDDFMSLEGLVDATERTSDQVRSAIWALSHYKAIESVESGGKLWWFITGEDMRTKRLEERVPEEQPRRTGPRKRVVRGYIPPMD